MSSDRDVYSRLYNPSSYTGVYAERFRGDGDGRINAHTDLSLRSGGKGFSGNTNTGTNEVIHDISSIMRPNLRSGYMHAQGKGRGAPGSEGRVQRRFSHASGMWKDVKGHAVNAGGSSLHLSADVPREMDTSEQLQHIFRYYCTFGRTGGDGTAQQTLDNSNFAKFSRECPGLLDRRLNKTEVDLIFTKAKPKFKRRLDFSHFLDALTAMANKKYPQYDAATAFSILLAHHVFQLPCAPVKALQTAGPNAVRSPSRKTTPRQEAPATGASSAVRERELSDRKAQLRAEHERQIAILQEQHRLREQELDQALEAGAGAGAASMSTPSPGAGVLGYAQRSAQSKGSSGRLSTYSQHERRYQNHASGVARNISSNSGGDRKQPRSGGMSKYGPSNAVIAGEANRPGGIYDRLSSPATFTGVYKKRFEGDGRINSHTDTTARRTGFKGNTNTGTNEKFHDIKGMLRPNLQSKGSRVMRF